MINKAINYAKKIICLSRFRKKWRKCNQHNETYASNVFAMDLVKVGVATYGSINISVFGNDNSSIEIGSYCSIAEGVTFLAGGEHNYNHISSYPFMNMLYNKKADTFSKGDILIGDDVWLGKNVLVLSGVSIGQGAVIGAGSVVSKSIPPYAIAAGNPIKIIKYRCDADRIKELLKCDFSKLNRKVIDENIEYLYTDINTADISWMPRK